MRESTAPMVLTTERLILRPQDPDDAVVFRQLWLERDPRVPAHRRIDRDGRPTEADIARYILEASGEGRPGLRTVVLRDTGKVIGYCGLVYDGHGDAAEPELAFELLRAVHGRGYATEAGWSIIAAAGETGRPRLWATVWDWNLPSRRVLEKLGFVETGEVTKESEHGRSLLTVRDPAD
jgi:RimJ/RimL family protein N-acetyltransferase